MIVSSDCMKVKDLAKKLNKIVKDGKGNFEIVNQSNEIIDWVEVELEYEETVTIGYN